MVRRAATAIISVAFALALGLAPADSAAQAEPADKAEPDPNLAQITQLNDAAVKAFEDYSFRSARRSLREAIGLARANDLLRTPEAARTQMLLAVAHISGSNDLYRGLHYMNAALRTNRKARVPQELLTPQLATMFKKARMAVRNIKSPRRIKLGGEKQEQATARVTGKAGTRGLDHALIDTAKRNFPIPVKAQPGLDIQAHRINLYYRSAGKVKFARRPMRQQGGVFRAKIPASATRGKYVHYYIEAVDQRGRLAASRGSARSPNIIIIK